MLKIRISRPSEAPEIIQIWKNSVDATHNFLTADDRQEIEKEVIGVSEKKPITSFSISWPFRKTCGALSLNNHIFISSEAFFLLIIEKIISECLILI